MTQTFDPSKPAHKAPLISEEIRNNFQSIASMHAGATAPPNIVEGMIWLDTGVANDWKLKQRLNSVWITLFDKITAIDSGTGAVLPHMKVILGEGYVHTQGAASASWVINHKLLKQYPTVVVVNGSDVTQAYTNITYTDNENLTINFAGAVTGKAILR